MASIVPASLDPSQRDVRIGGYVIYFLDTVGGLE